MTREEAAQLLWRVAHDKYGPDDNPMRQREAADIVVTALRGSADKTKEFCMMVNQCIACGAEMPEGDQVCTRCRERTDFNRNASQNIDDRIRELEAEIRILRRIYKLVYRHVQTEEKQNKW